jgi:hypothetical protein
MRKTRAFARGSAEDLVCKELLSMRKGSFASSSDAKSGSEGSPE